MIFVLGIDGATPEIVFPLAGSGHLPNFRRMMEQGVWGRLRSTIHPLTPQAWATFVTGVNPGKHGIFDFGVRRPGSYFLELVNSTHRRAPGLWSRVCEAGMTAGTMNIPLSYPPEKFQGFSVGIYLTLSTVVLYTYGMATISKSRTTRVYADTSVFGGMFDEEFETASKAFFDTIKKGSFKLITSELVREELQAGPQKVIDIFEEFLVIAEIAEITDSVLQLQQSYVQADIVSEKFATDAMHVALATISEADLIVSWNFKHIVNFQKIPLYNAVNTLNGFGKIAIYSPLEVTENED